MATRYLYLGIRMEIRLNIKQNSPTRPLYLGRISVKFDKKDFQNTTRPLYLGRPATYT